MKLQADRVIAFRPEIAKELGSITAAVLYQQLLFWSDKGERSDGFIYKSRRELEDETALTVQQIRTATKVLVGKEWLKVKTISVHGWPMIHYKCQRVIQTSVKTTPASVKTATGLMQKQQTYNKRLPREDNNKVSKKTREEVRRKLEKRGLIKERNHGDILKDFPQ